MLDLNLIQNGLLIVANSCDNATEIDGAGFNKLDWKTGKYLAYGNNSEWSTLEKKQAITLFKKYRKQHEIKIPPEIIEQEIFNLTNSNVDRVINVVDNIAHISFNYDRNLVTSVKELKASFNFETKLWSLKLNPNNIDNLVNFATEKKFTVIGNYQESNEPKNTFNGKIYLENKVIYFQFEYDRYLVNDLKSIDIIKKYNPETKIWSSTINLLRQENFEAIENLAREYNLELDPKIKDLVYIEPKKEEIIQDNLLKILQEKYPFLMPFQFEGVKHIVSKDNSYLGDTMGCGKTVQALVSIDYSNEIPCLIICPNTLKFNWEQEVKKFTPNKTVFIISAKTKEIPLDKDIYVINYDIVSKKLNELKRIDFKFLVIDESHMLKNAKSLRFKSISELIYSLDLNKKLLMSGTCITNRPKELAPQLKLLGTLHQIVSKEWDFYIKYCDAYKTTFGWNMSGASNTKELHNKLTSTCYLRREKEQVVKDLPEKTISIIPLEINNRTEYNKAENDLVEYLQEVGKQINLSAQHLTQIEILKQLVVKGKLEAVKEWIKDIIDSEEKLIIFAHHKETIKELKISFPDALTIDGSTSIEDRNFAVNEFQNNPSKKLILCSIKAAGVGITLTASNIVGFVEIGWTPAEHAQAEDRAYRIGQKNNVNCYYLLGKDTIEDLKIMPLIKQKEIVFNSVARGVEVSKKDLNSSIFSDFIDSMLKK